MAKPSILEVAGISKRFGTKMVLEDVSFTLVAGETLTIMAPSGTGKSTLLRIIAGLEQPDRGRVVIQGHDVTDLPPEQRHLGYVFQQYALFPHLTVFENLAFPLRLQRRPSAEIRRRVGAALHSINLHHAAAHRPTTLSGGEQQRVAIMRAVMSQPVLLLLDEPFAALDQYLQEQLQSELWKLRDELQIAVLLVSHDAPFGLAISDRIMLLDRGHMVQTGTPREIFEAPINRFVAQITGPINCFVGQLIRTYQRQEQHYGVVRLAQGREVAGLLRAPPTDDVATLLVRPHRVQIARIGSEDALLGAIRAMQYRGSHVSLIVETTDGTTVTVERPQAELDGFIHNENVYLSWKPDEATIV